MTVPLAQSDSARRSRRDRLRARSCAGSNAPTPLRRQAWPQVPPIPPAAVSQYGVRAQKSAMASSPGLSRVTALAKSTCVRRPPLLRSRDRRCPQVLSRRLSSLHCVLLEKLQRRWRYSCAPLLPANAAEVIEDIVVTSQLRATPLAELPTSVTTLDADTIERASLQHFEELTRLVPNLNWSGEGSRARYFQLRGTGELEQYEGAPNPSVGFIIDDIDFSGIGGAATLFDAERVEVLRGPQGTRYGANALAGLVYYQSAAPSFTPEAWLEATGGSDDTLSVGGAAGGPVPGLQDQLAYRVVRPDLSQQRLSRQRLSGPRRYLRTRRVHRPRAPALGAERRLARGFHRACTSSSTTAMTPSPSTTASRRIPTSPAATRSRRSPAACGWRATWVMRCAWSASPAWRTRISSSVSMPTGATMTFWNRPQFGNSIYDYTSSTRRDRRSLSQEFRLLSQPATRLFGRADWLLGVFALRLDEGNARIDLGRDSGFFCPDPCVTTVDSDYRRHQPCRLRRAGAAADRSAEPDRGPAPGAARGGLCGELCLQHGGLRLRGTEQLRPDRPAMGRRTRAELRVVRHHPALRPRRPRLQGRRLQRRPGPRRTRRARVRSSGRTIFRMRTRPCGITRPAGGAAATTAAGPSMSPRSGSNAKTCRCAFRSRCSRAIRTPSCS